MTNKNKKLEIKKEQLFTE